MGGAPTILITAVFRSGSTTNSAAMSVSSPVPAAAHALPNAASTSTNRPTQPPVVTTVTASCQCLSQSRLWQYVSKYTDNGMSGAKLLSIYAKIKRAHCWPYTSMTNLAGLWQQHSRIEHSFLSLAQAGLPW